MTKLPKGIIHACKPPIYRKTLGTWMEECICGWYVTGKTHDEVYSAGNKHLIECENAQ